MKLSTEVRTTTLYGKLEEDEVLLHGDGKCLAHLERMQPDMWWMALYTHDGKRLVVHIRSHSRISVTTSEEAI